MYDTKYISSSYMVSHLENENRDKKSRKCELNLFTPDSAKYKTHKFSTITNWRKLKQTAPL